jgi:CheY-like chemotaxis protein
MDIKMPELNGYDALAILRSQGFEIPIIAQTAYARIEDETKALAAGFDGYISKPINRGKLDELIEKFF